MSMWEAVWPLAGAVAAGLASWRAHQAAQATRHVALERLRWSFLLLAVAAVVQTAQAAVYLQSLSTGGPSRIGFDLYDALFWIHHGCIVAALAVAAGAFVGAMAPVLLVAGPTLSLAEAMGFLALTAWTARNLVRRATAASLRVTLGFLLLSVAQATMAWQPPLGPRPWYVEVAWAVGLLLLWAGLPRRPELG